jgi:glycosyltransferase involved in cell wall biosynthesis
LSQLKQKRLKPAMNNANPLRILHLTASSASGGLSRYLLDLCVGLRSRGHEATVAGMRGEWQQRFDGAGIPWIDLSMTGGPLALRKAGAILRRRIEEHPVDILHAHYRRCTIVARRAVAGGGPPILFTLHLSGIPLGLVRRWMSDFGDHTHAPSQNARQWLIDEARLAPDHITMIPHGIDASRIPKRDATQKSAARAALGIPPDALVAAFVGRLDDPKNAHWMLDVAEAAGQAIVLIAGDGPDAPILRRLIEERRLSSRVRMLGERDVLPIYQAADALLLPSLREGFGLVCAEAMCVGVPVLRTRTSGTEELIIEGTTGRSVPIDRRQFVSAAVEFLSDHAALQKMGDAAAEHIRSHFTPERQIDQTIELYRRLAATKRG